MERENLGGWWSDARDKEIENSAHMCNMNVIFSWKIGRVWKQDSIFSSVAFEGKPPKHTNVSFFSSRSIFFLLIIFFLSVAHAITYITPWHTHTRAHKESKLYRFSHFRYCLCNMNTGAYTEWIRMCVCVLLFVLPLKLVPFMSSPSVSALIHTDCDCLN